MAVSNIEHFLALRNSPVHVSDPKDLALETTDMRIGPPEFDGNRRKAKIRAHGIVCNAGSNIDRGGQVEEQAIRPMFR